jgi:uncharacterized protein (TIGR00369 family)
VSGVASDDPRFGPGAYSALLGFHVVHADADGAVVEATPSADHTNGAGIIHGGYLSSLLDTTTGWAIHARLAAGTGAPHTHLSVQYVRAALPDITLVCRGRCLSAGRRAASADAEITQRDRLIARAITTHIVLVPPRASAPG